MIIQIKNEADKQFLLQNFDTNWIPHTDYNCICKTDVPFTVEYVETEELLYFIQTTTIQELKNQVFDDEIEEIGEIKLNQL